MAQLTYVGKLTLGQIIPGYSDALEKVFAQENAISEQIGVNIKEIAAAQKKVTFLAETLSSSQDAVTAASNILSEAQDVLGEISELSGRLEDALSQGGIYFYVYTGRANQLGSALNSEFSTGLTGGTTYGADEAIAAAVFVSGSDGGIVASGSRVLNMFKTMGVNFENIKLAFDDVYAGVEAEFGPQ